MIASPSPGSQLLLEKGWLRDGAFGLPKVAQTNAHEAIVLPWAKINPLSQS